MKSSLQTLSSISLSISRIARIFKSKSGLFSGIKIAMTAALFFCSSILFSQQVYTFTNAGATGQQGPSQAQLNAAYNATTLSGQVTSSAGVQLWTVPISGLYRIEAAGAKGGGANNFGKGVIIQADVLLNAGQVLKIIVGQSGNYNTGVNGSGSGGGGTFVVTNANVPIVVAGGGGGQYNASASLHNANASTTNNGFNTGCPNGTGQGGTNGNGGTGCTNSGAAGGGGLLTDGSSGTYGTGGRSFINGGIGGNTSSYAECIGGFGGGGGTHGNTGGGGGGGGYTGGGGGYHSTADGSGGGGGSYTISSTMLLATSDGKYNSSTTFNGDPIGNLNAFNSGHGYVKFTIISSGSADIEAISVVPVTSVPFSMCRLNEYEFDITVKNNGPDDASYIDLSISMNGMDSVKFSFFDIRDLLNGQTKTYRVSSKKLNPTKAGNHILTFDILRVLSDDDDLNNNQASANWVVNSLPRGAEFTPAVGFPGFPKDGDKFNPDHITYNKTYRYNFTAPIGFNNGNFGTSWDASFKAMLNGSPMPGSKFNYSPPTGGNNAFVEITLSESELDAEVQMLYTVFDMTGTGCDSTTNRYARVMPSPKLDFEGTLVCEGDELQFVNKSSIASGVNTYVWDFGDGNGSILFEPKHKYQSVGIYPTKLIATSNLGFVDSITINVEVNPAPVLDYTFQNQCGALPVIFQNNTTVAAGNMSFTWDFGDGSTSNDINPSYTYPVAGPYEVTLAVETDKGCYSELKKSAYSYPTPIVNFNTPTTVCAGDNISLQNTTTIPFSTWGSEWTIGSSNTRTFTKNPSYVFKQFGEQAVKLKITTQYGCVDSLIKMITVNPGPAIDITHSDVCSSGPVIFNSNITVPQGMAVDYIWNIAGTLYASSNPVVNFGASGTKDVSVDITYANGCKNNASTQVLTGYKPNASFDVPAVVCSGEPVLISNNTTIEFGNASNTWIMGDGAIYTGVFVPNHVYSNTNPEQYTITLISASSNGQCPDTVSHEVNVGIVPSCDFDIIETYVPGHRGYSFVPTQSGASYTWYYGDGRTSTSASPVYQFERDGEFNVRLVVTTDEGCQCETSKLHSVYNLNTDLILAQNGFSIYPNPSNGIVKVGNAGNINVSTINVVNVIGETVYSQSENNSDSEFVIDLSKLANGVYLIKITTEDNNVLTQKIIISK